MPAEEQDPPAQTPLLDTESQSLEQAASTAEVEEEGSAAPSRRLDGAVNCLETFLSILGFCQTSPPLRGLLASWLAFLLLGVALPLLIIVRLSGDCSSNCDQIQMQSFELEILVSDAAVAAVALFGISRNLRKYGLRKFLFVDISYGNAAQFHDEYTQKIYGFFHQLAMSVIPCFLVKTSRVAVRLINVHHDRWWLSVAMFVALLVSWTYSAVLYISGAAMFNLVCNLQVIHLENYGKLLEMDMDVSLYIEEHIRLTHYLSKISHRFRIYLLLEFTVVTVCQVLALAKTTGNPSIINFINGGDFVVSSIVQLVGIFLCLHAAAKISHRAQSLGSVASRWHALVTCSPNNASQTGHPCIRGNLESTFPVNPLSISYSESDLESIDYVPMSTNMQLASYMSSYHKRQAFVTYLQSNLRGVTVFGWTVDRGLISTIFVLELTLVLFVLGETIDFTT